MQETPDIHLLQQYVKEGSDEAFAALVTRHLNLVYSAALRKTGNPHAAEEIAQAVFIILAKKAGELHPKTILSGWLYQTARLTASNFLRNAIRRAHREQEAYMQSLSNETESEVWQQITPLLDDAMGALGENDRNGLVLRFFEGKNFQEIGTAFGATENAAKKRVGHALEKLRRYFSKRGVASTTAILAGVVSANSIQAAPAALATSITAAAVAKGAAASGSTLTLVKGALKLMAWTKAKLAIVVGASVLLATGTTTVIVKNKSANIDDSYFDSQKLWAAPANILVLRPTHFTNRFGGMTANRRKSGQQQQESRMVGMSQTIEQVLSIAYGIAPTRLVLPPNLPQNKFDFMVTMPAPDEEHQKERLRMQVKKQLGLAGRREEPELDVLLLKVKAPGASGLKPHKGHNSSMQVQAGKIQADGQTLKVVAYYSEYALKQLVVDQTGLAGDFDFVLDAHTFDGTADSNAVRSALSELGLELVPSRQPVEMLVVEKSN